MWWQGEGWCAGVVVGSGVGMVGSEGVGMVGSGGVAMVGSEGVGMVCAAWKPEKSSAKMRP